MRNDYYTDRVNTKVRMESHIHPIFLKTNETFLFFFNEKMKGK